MDFGFPDIFISREVMKILLLLSLSLLIVEEDVTVLYCSVVMVEKHPLFLGERI